MKIVFFGTPDYVLPILDSLYKVYGKGKEGIILVVTQAPKPVGRNKIMTYSPVDKWAFEKKIPKTADLGDVTEADLGVVAAYGKIIPESVIKKFKYGILNVHPSLLPKYRGASPIQSAIAAGEAETGVTIIKMDTKIDHGPIVSRFKESIEPQDTNETLRTKLFERSAKFLIELIPSYITGVVKPKDQDESQATLTKVMAKEDGFINPEELARAINGKGAAKIHNLVRAMYPWPGAWTRVKIKKDGMEQTLRLKMISSHLEGETLVPDEVQLEGKNPVKWQQFLDSYQFSLAF